MIYAFAIFGWSYCATKVPVLKTLVPTTSGFAPFSVLTFLGVYLVARSLRQLDMDKLKTWWLVVFALISGAACWVGFYHHNSPFSILLVCAVFLLARRIPIERVKFADKVINALVPSLFSVYLLHTNEYGFGLLREVEKSLIESGWNYYLMSFGLAVGIFVGCIVIDLPRRGVVGLISKVLRRA